MELFPTDRSWGRILGFGAFALLVGSANAPAQRRNEDLSVSGSWRGIVKAVQQPTLSSELSTPIAAIGFREGQRFASGANLIEFDCRRHHHELAALAANVREARVVVQTNSHLERRGASNANDVEIARARHEKAVAEHAALRQRLAGCTIAAPFDGIVIEIGAAVHETPAAGRPLMTIASADAIEVEMIVEAHSLPQLKIGTPLTFQVDHRAQAYPLTIARVAGAVDAVSQTAKVYAVFSGDITLVLPGLSGTVSNSGAR